ncbi:unnamed protein product [Darwinula stevensoni]|uniref:Prolyl endopeptidase n=1 Tax=Darwinula stevensoni TaxID=69355 RepID=A0A7R9A2C2_9CRUS|nr:unnamed protein product [Darwinula stevensoni]CAG0879625.1 unnamed protein product [Darwinula stevensoni]
MEESAKKYLKITSYPSSTSAWIRPSAIDGQWSLTVASEVRNPIEERKITQSTTFILRKTESIRLEGRLQGSVRVTNECSECPPSFCVQAHDFGRHSDTAWFTLFCNRNKTFGSLVWSHNERKLAYVAEEKFCKSPSFFNQGASESGSQAKKGEGNAWRESWGELLTKTSATVVSVIDTDTDEVLILDWIPESDSPSQIAWAPDDSGIIGVAYKKHPFRLGVVYCTNRASQIFFASLSDKGYRYLSHENRSVREPRFSPSGDKLIFLECEVGGPHAQTSTLASVEWSSGKWSCLVPLVYESSGDFSGVNGNATLLPLECFSSDGHYLVFNSVHQCAWKIFLLDMVTLKLSCISPELDDSYYCMGFNYDILVAKVSNLLNPNGISAALWQGHLDLKWEVLSEMRRCEPVPTGSSVRMLLSLPASSIFGKGEEKNFHAILTCLPKSGSMKYPLVLFPHGGPHSVFTNEFSSHVAMFTACGYAVLLVNYRGSLGTGEAGVRSLPGRVGVQDVKDCYDALLHVLKSEDFPVDKEKLFLYGGSHGGFLVAHLAGQYPNTFRAACVRNPVTNIATMTDATDIPDWGFVEAGMLYEPGKYGDPEMMKVMFQCSPVSVIDHVKIPVLLLVGDEDSRVPPSQTYSYHRALLSRGVKTKLYNYPDNHALMKPSVDGDVIMHVIGWFHDAMLS